MWYKHFGACFFVLIVLVIACNREEMQVPKKSGKEASVETPLQSPEIRTPTPLVLPCGGMTKESAAEILGVTAEDIQYSYSEELRLCRYQAAFSKTISYAMYAATDQATAQAEMMKVAEGLKFLVACEPVASVAEAAIYCHGKNAERLLVREGKVWLDIHTPSGLDEKISVVRQILK
ncbi:MAG: hypothetical protein CSA31_01300 [Desulfobulbus propionicus]|nr:MAG: hypothetical protein CSA31_01300 [Desulfobulbus propionicus]